MTPYWSESPLSQRRFGGPASRHGSTSSLFQVALYLPSEQVDPPGNVAAIAGGRARFESQTGQRSHTAETPAQLSPGSTAKRRKGKEGTEEGYETVYTRLRKTWGEAELASGVWVKPEIERFGAKLSDVARPSMGGSMHMASALQPLDGSMRSVGDLLQRSGGEPHGRKPVGGVGGGSRGSTGVRSTTGVRSKSKKVGALRGSSALGHLQVCSHVTALEPVDCLIENRRTQLTALR